jgi:uncharacterized protein YvpB
MKKLIFLSLAILFLSGCGQANIAPNFNINTETIPKTVVNDNKTGTEANTGNTPVVNTAPKVVSTDQSKIPKPVLSLPKDLKSEINLPVTFVSQAPFANWDYLHNEACEEASMIMAVKYFKGEALDKQIMEDEIQKISKWEGENGYAVDLTANEVVKILANYFYLPATLSREVTADKIKQELSQGNLIIVPLAGRDLGNPYYRQPGPIFHMLLIRGYDATNFITNDPGTKHGEGYKYSYGDLLWAVHDWIGGARPADESLIDMNKGAKVMIIVEKNR